MSEAPLLRLCALDEVDEDAMRRVQPDGHPPFAVYNVAGTYYVTDDTCTHGKASLADEGYLEGHEVICSWHEGRFDVRSGEPCAAPCSIPLRSHPVTLRDGAVWIAPG